MTSLRSRERTSAYSSDGLFPAAALAQRYVSLMDYQPYRKYGGGSDEETIQGGGFEEHARGPGDEKTGGDTVEKNCPRPHATSTRDRSGVDSHVRPMAGADSTGSQLKSPATLPTRYSS